MTIPGVGQLTALAFVAAIDDASRIRRSRDNDGAGAGTEYEVKSLMQRPFNESLDLAKDTNSEEALCAPSVQAQYSTDIVLLKLQVFGAGFDSDSAIYSFDVSRTQAAISPRHTSRKTERSILLVFAPADAVPPSGHDLVLLARRRPRTPRVSELREREPA
jgi:Transposase IS116/IS110/IS902 family